MQALSFGMAAVLVLNHTQAESHKIAIMLPKSDWLNIWEDLAKGLSVMLSFRTFKRALTAPLLF